MQRGRASPAYQGGAFSLAMDGPMHCFHRWVARQLLAAAPSAVAAEWEWRLGGRPGLTWRQRSPSNRSNRATVR